MISAILKRNEKTLAKHGYIKVANKNCILCKEAFAGESCYCNKCIKSHDNTQSKSTATRVKLTG